ncbi:MAG TPA: toxin-antitoxin system HicB family antitoxin [Casimicrobiaceae bacterium]|nr:toxin-antitoxin system HicB family antitoxin [Casimicrobiaceae bacterium]
MAEKKAFLLRLDPGVWTALERLAQGDLRSVNAEIEYLLRDALSRRGVEPRPRPPPTSGRTKDRGALD